VELVLTIAVLAFVGLRLVEGVRFSRSRAGRERLHSILGGIGLRHLWPVPLVLVAVVTAATVLMQIPGLSWGWWTALGGLGNPVTGTTEATTGTPLAWIIPLVFIALLFPALPLFAFAEEVMFRRGAEGWSFRRRAWMCLKFGLIHAVIGIPIGVALALSVGGAYFMAVYLRSFRQTSSQHEALLESTRAHTVYNASILVVVVLAVLVGGV
jgi:hypothetical protein